jgi:hypothetical protein
MAEHWNGGSGGKGSKPRPFSVNQQTFEDRWEMAFGKKNKKQPVKLHNPLNKEVWFCEDFSNIKTVDGVDYVTVYKEETPERTHLMRKDALQK